MTLKEESIKVLGFYPPEEKKRRIWTDKNGGTEYELTPERAAFILKYFNEENRELSSAQVKNISESREEYGWIDDGDVVRFQKNGNISEWQHRFYDIANNNVKGVTVEIRFGVKDGASTKTANAKARSPYDRIHIVDKTVKKSEVSTLKKMTEYRVYKSKPKGKELDWNTALEIWPKWKTYARKGESLTKDFFENTSKWSFYRRVFAAVGGMCAFHDKEEVFKNFLKQLEDYTLDGEGTTVAREFVELAEDRAVATMSNTRRPHYYWQLICVALDRLEKKSDGRISMAININNVSHDKLMNSGNYRLFLENPQNIPTTVVYSSEKVKQAIESDFAIV